MSHHGVSRFLSKRDKTHVGRHHGKEKVMCCLIPKHEQCLALIAHPFFNRSHTKHPQYDKFSTEANMGVYQNVPEKADQDAGLTPSAELYSLFSSPGKAADSHEEQQVKILRRRMMEKKSLIMKDPQILYALRSDFARRDTDLAFDLLMAISNSSEGLLAEYNPAVKLMGAVNRERVTCFLDSVLFAMFSRLDSFEAILYNTFDDVPRSKLALLLRLWVNLLRSGRLITPDITKLIQQSLAECGWADAANLHQQDASEAFTFITERLKLPLLTLKMDIHHGGREDATDDHKFINERLLEVAVPSEAPGDNQLITLEDCLEDYFNNRVEVRRYLERRSTLSSVRSHDSISAKAGTVHVETVEVDADSLPPTPLAPSPGAASLTRPSKHRAASIIQQRFVPDQDDPGDASMLDIGLKRPVSKVRTGSIRKEVLMPAWQFFSLIPWYTDNTPSSDTQVAAHFSSKRPMLGICLKRYSVAADGTPRRVHTQIDIPVEIGLPHFIQDDHIENDGLLYGNFKLSLQSVVCHRGKSVNSGHYVALVRGTNATADSAVSHGSTDAKHWMRFDDLATQRITLVNIENALKEEMPYLLFYQIVPVEGDPGHITEGEHPPVYASSEAHDSGIGGISTASLSLKSTREDELPPGRRSFEITAPDSPRGRLVDPEARRPSVIVTPSTSVAAGEGDRSDQKSAWPSSRPVSLTRRASSHGRRSSQPSEFLTRSLSKLSLGGRKSKDALPSYETIDNPEVVVREVPSSTTEPGQIQPVSRKDGKREKSKNRLSKVPGSSGKARVEKPDRECSVM